MKKALALGGALLIGACLLVSPGSGSATAVLTSDEVPSYVQPIPNVYVAGTDVGLPPALVLAPAPQMVPQSRPVAPMVHVSVTAPEPATTTTEAPQVDPNRGIQVRCEVLDNSVDTSVGNGAVGWYEATLSKADALANPASVRNCGPLTNG